MNILLWILFGGIVGWITSSIMDTDSQQSPLLNVILGIVGSMLGGWLMTTLEMPGITGFDLWSFLVAILGAVILVGLVKITH